MKEKKGGFLRWPWNVVVYVLLFAVLWVFAIPIILILMWMQRKNNPHGVEEGFCLSRTRKRISWVAWGLVCLAVAAGLFYIFSIGLRQDQTYWDSSDRMTLWGSLIAGVVILLLGAFLTWQGGQDAFSRRRAIWPSPSAASCPIRTRPRRWRNSSPWWTGTWRRTASGSALWESAGSGSWGTT